MPIETDSAHAGALRAVDDAIERAWEADRFTLEGGLRAGLAEGTGAVPSPASREVFQRYGPPLAALVRRYAGPGPDRLPDAAEREATAAALHGMIADLVRDLVAVGAVSPGPVVAEADPYESPTLHRAVHDVHHVVERKDAAPGKDEAPAVPDRSPGAAARRREQRAERALKQAERTIDAVDWDLVDEQNQMLLAQIRIDQRIAVLWLSGHELLVLGQGNTGYAAIAGLTGVPEAGVHIASLQRGPVTGFLRRTATARLAGVPEQEQEAVTAAFLAYGVQASFAARSRWDG
ncbi:hypothetical protein EES43_02940 [Streptomyces sp. ADI96-02]|uniref:hypothetical protein n=1 Tax=Streptomyces sp. ADI96-02 TaxID=1522760 RepID=UPI000F54F07C|nr:hypothetical protein [Streptomyces sp. ADI96-02]RPK67631.1 hypothetical protein EES43_02940 [Streptomyces sp. ADI96-02]